MMSDILVVRYMNPVKEIGRSDVLCLQLDFRRLEI